MGAEICGVGGPREATSDCILRPGHSGEHRDASAGTWPYAEKPRHVPGRKDVAWDNLPAPEPREDVAVAEVHLTDAERWALRDMALWSQSATLFANVERIIAERERAAAVEAWDEGYIYALDDDPRALDANPYRADRRAER